MGKDRIGLVVVAHVFLDSEVRHPEIEVERGAHADRRQVGGAVAAGADLKELSQRGDPAQLRDAAGMNHGSPDVVDELILDELAAVVDGVEDFAEDRKSTRLNSSH